MEYILKDFREELQIKRLANIHYFEFMPRYSTSADRHAFCELVYVDQGRMQIRSEHYTGTLNQSELIIHGSNEQHALVCEECAAPNIIVIGFECDSPHIERLTHRPLLLTEELKKLLGDIVKESRTVFLPPYDIPNTADMKKRESFPFGADQMLRDFLQIFLIKCLRLSLSASEPVPSDNPQSSAPPAYSRICEVKQYLDDNYTQKINLDTLSFLFNTNKTSLSKEFKQVYEETIVHYINRLRIEYTKKLLRGQNHTLTQIADSLNFSSVHYLTALFKQYTNTTPTEYIRSIRKQLDM